MPGGLDIFCRETEMGCSSGLGLLVSESGSVLSLNRC